MALTDLFEAIEQGKRAEVAGDVGPWPKNQPTCSDLSPCARETALAILHWKDRPPMSPEVMMRLTVGTEAEGPAMGRLHRYGFKVVEQQSWVELRDKRGRLILRGKIDGMIEWQGRRIPFDYKTVDPRIYPRLNTLNDLLEHPFFRKWPNQLWSYEYGKNIETGFLLLDNLLGLWKCIEVPLDWERMDALVRQCEVAVEAVEQVRGGTPEAEALPAYHENPAVCRRCWAFGRVCTPPAEYHGLAMATDPELEAEFDRRAALEPAHREYEALDKALKERVKGKDGLVVGNWLVQGKALTVNYKAQPARVVEQWRSTFTRITGADPVSD